MTKSSLSPHFRPVMDAGRCVGHLIHSVRGWDAYGRDDRLVGTFGDEAEAAAALLAPTPA